MQPYAHSPRPYALWILLTLITAHFDSRYGAGAGYFAWVGICLLYVSVATMLVGLVELKAKGGRS